MSDYDLTNFVHQVDGSGQPLKRYRVFDADGNLVEETHLVEEFKDASERARVMRDRRVERREAQDARDLQKVREATARKKQAPKASPEATEVGELKDRVSALTGLVERLLRKESTDEE